MGFLDQIGGVLEQYSSGANGNVPREQAHEHYDQIAKTVPHDVLGSLIGPALASLGGGQVEERIRNSASQMSPDIRSQFLQKLLGAVSAAGGNGSSLLSRLGLDPSLAQQPQQASADDVAKVAGAVHQEHPDAFSSAMEFYSRHPTLVKVLGTVVIAKIAQRLSQSPPSQ